MSRVVLQKLLPPGMSGLISERGYDQVGGYVVEAAAAASLRTPQDLRAAHGFAEDGNPWVDVVRFLLPACATLAQPSREERPWPSYPAGFLRPVNDDIVPAWMLSTTRYSPGAEMWRVHSDGRQELITAYGGAARGWSGAREWRPSSRYFGTRAVWNGTEYAADIRGETVEVTSFVEPSGEGWAQHRPMTWSRALPIHECEIYELQFRASLQGQPVRVLEVIGTDTRVQLLADGPAVAQQFNAHMTDYGVFELSGVPGTALADTALLANQLAPSA